MAPWFPRATAFAVTLYVRDDQPLASSRLYLALVGGHEEIWMNSQALS